MLQKLFEVKVQHFRFFEFFSKTVSFFKKIPQTKFVDLKILYKMVLISFSISITVSKIDSCVPTHIFPLWKRLTFKRLILTKSGFRNLNVFFKDLSIGTHHGYVSRKKIFLNQFHVWSAPL